MKKQSFSKLALLGLATGLVTSAALPAESPANTGQEIARGGCGANTCSSRTSSTRDRRYNPVADNETTTPEQQQTAPQSGCSGKQSCNGKKTNDQTNNNSQTNNNKN